MEGNMDRLLEEFLTSIADSPLDVDTTGDMSQLHHVASTDEVSEIAGVVDSNYRQRLRSYSSFPASGTEQAVATEAATTSSDTSSQAGGADLMEVAYAHSLSDGAGSDQRRRVRRQVRKRTGGQYHFRGRNSRADVAELEVRSSRRTSYDCDVCGQTFRTPQSLGGHKNLHKGKKKTSSRSRGSRGAPDQLPGVSSQSNSSCESEGVPSPIYKGVRCREGTKWVSEIRPPKSSDKWWLGTFPSAEEAAQAYDVALCYFKSETDLNFDLHDRCRKLPPIPPNLSTNKFAQRLREMVKDVSEQIIADRRRTSTSTLPEPAQTASSSQPTVSGDSSSTEAPSCTAILDLPTLPDFVTSNDFDPLLFLI